MSFWDRFQNKITDLLPEFPEALDPNAHQAHLGKKAMMYMDLGDHDSAMDLLKEQERICRGIGNKDGLQKSLGDQALILMAGGDLDGAMKLLHEQERICRELGNVDGQARSLANQAVALALQGRRGDASSAIDEALAFAIIACNNTLALQIRGSKEHYGL